MRIALVSLAVLVVVLAAAFTLAPVRGVLLGWGLAAADRALPGTFEVGRSAWPRLGTIELEDLRWLGPADDAPADTLLHLRRLMLAVDAGELTRRDLAVDSLLVDVGSVDVPGVQAILPAGGGAAASDTAGASGEWTAAWPRAGSVPGLPSAAVRRASVHLRRARLAPDLTARDLRAAGNADLRADIAPEASVLVTGGGFDLAGQAPQTVALDTLALRARWDGAWGGVVADSARLVVSAAGPPPLAERWAGLEPLRVGGSGRVRLRGADADGAVALRLTAPGLPLLGRAPPAGLDSTALARVVAAVEAEGGIADGTVTAKARADLAGTPGLDRALLALRTSFPDSAPTAGRVDVDTLEVALPGVALSASGSGADGRIRARADVRARTPVPLLVCLVPAAAEVDGGIAGTVTVDGTVDDPRLALDLRGDARTGEYAVPWFSVAVHGDRRDLTANLAAGGGLAVRDSVAVDSLRAHLRVRPAAAGDLVDAARLRLDVDGRVRGPGRVGSVRLAASAELPRDEPLGGLVDVDTLALDWPGLAVHGSGRVDTATVDGAVTVAVSSPCPLLAALVPEAVTGTFAGDLSLRLQGAIRDPQVAVSATGSCDLPQATVPRFALSAEGDRRDFTATVRAGGGLVVQGTPLADSLALDAGLHPAGNDSLPLQAGLEIWRPGLHLGVAAAAGTDSAATAATVRLDSLGLDMAGGTLRLLRPALVRVDTAARRFDVVDLDLQGSAGTVALDGSLAPDRARLAATVDLDLSEAMLQAAAPAAIWSRNGGMDVSARGRLDLATGVDSTRLGGGLAVGLHPHRDDPHVGVSLDFGLDQGDTAGLGARFAVTAADTVLLHGSAVLPGRYDAASRRWLPADDDRLLVTVPEQAIPMGLVHRMLPEDTSLRGTVTLGVSAAMPVGAAGDSAKGARLEGLLRTRDLRVNLPNNSRAEVRADCQLSGTPADPKLSGTVTVPSGFVRIPELPRSLLPAKGTPALWSVAAPDDSLLNAEGVGADSVRTAWGPGDVPEAPPAAIPDLDLKVSLPGNFVIHGYGLDTEVAADVHITRGYDRAGRPGPSLRGSAHAVRGTLRFMNRRFDVVKAEATFTGAVPPDPELDVQLEALVDATTIRLRVTGRASDPVVELTSIPDMNEVDIMAVLLFGRTENDLDTDQRGRAQSETDPAKQFRENMAGLALAFGTADLQNSVSSTLGVDIVELGADATGGSTLTAGKYLSPKILVKYNSSLEKSGTYFLSLEYTLTQIFRIVSTYGRGEQASGLELKWLRRY